MTNSGLVVYEKDIPATLRFTRKETNKLFDRKIDYSKYDDHCEVAHLEISNECNMNCKYCYVQDKKGETLHLGQWFDIIEALHQYGIFQITFGGGEPLLNQYFITLAQHAIELNMNVAITTNGILIPKLLPAVFSTRNFKQVNVSWHQNPKIVKAALRHLQKGKAKIGINYCYSKEMAKDNKTVKALAKKYNAELLYLAYKPVVGDKDNIIPPSDIYKIAKEAANEGLKVAVDGPCVGLCMMKKRFVDINHKGDVFPCSFVRKSLGNLLEKDFHTIWRQRGEQEPCPYLDIERRNTDGE